MRRDRVCCACACACRIAQVVTHASADQRGGRRSMSWASMSCVHASWQARLVRTSCAATASRAGRARDSNPEARGSCERGTLHVAMAVKNVRDLGELSATTGLSLMRASEIAKRMRGGRARRIRRGGGIADGPAMRCILPRKATRCREYHVRCHVLRLAVPPETRSCIDRRRSLPSAASPARRECAAGSRTRRRSGGGCQRRPGHWTHSGGAA
jgi:hypothetical protein